MCDLFRSLHHYTSPISLLICDVVFDKVPYCGTNIEGLGQTPRITRGVWSGPTIFVAHEHLKKTFLSLPVQWLSKNTFSKVLKQLI